MYLFIGIFTAPMKNHIHGVDMNKLAVAALILSSLSAGAYAHEAGNFSCVPVPRL
jgi:hypothetical protein